MVNKVFILVIILFFLFLGYLFQYIHSVKNKKNKSLLIAAAKELKWREKCRLSAIQIAKEEKIKKGI